MTPIVAMTEQDLREFADYAAEKAIERLAETHIITPRDPWLTIPEAAIELAKRNKRDKPYHVATIKRKIDSGELKADGAGALRRVKI